MKMIKNILIGFIVVAAVLLAGKNFIVKAAVENGVKLVTGLGLKMDKLDVNLSKTYIDIDNLRLLNPDGYPEPVMVDIPDIFVDYDLPAILKGKVHLTELRFDLKEFVVVKTKSGELNLDKLKALQQQTAPQGGQAQEPQAKKEPAKAPEIQLDVFKLRIGKAVYMDYSGGGDQPVVREFNVGLNEQFTNITDPNKLVQLIVFKVMIGTPLAALTNFNLSGLQGSVASLAASGSKLADQAFDQASATLKDTAAQASKLIDQAAGSKTAQEAASKVTDAAKDLTGALGGLKNKVKLPFGQSDEN